MHLIRSRSKIGQVSIMPKNYSRFGAIGKPSLRHRSA
jgi:hypothetical protein